MKYIIYMDVFFMVNLVMDIILLKLAAFYIKPQTTFVRCLVGGATGSLITCLSLLLSYEHMMVHMLVSYIFTVAIMVFVTYGKCNLKQMVKRAGWLYFITVLMGGAMNLVYDYTYFGYMLHGIITAVYKNPINILCMCFFTGISYIVMRLLLYLVNRAKSNSGPVTVRVVIKGKSAVIKGLIDSGNSLTDPYFGKPVHIVEYDAVQRILEGVDIHKEKYRLVPFHSLGKKDGLVEVIEIDELEVLGEEGGNNKDDGCKYREEKPAIGLYYSSLSGSDEFNMLLHKNILDNWR